MNETWAILTDVHGNLPALEAVLRDAAQQGATRLAVLGDSVNYGAEPVACFEQLASVADVMLLGNHEQAVLSDDGVVGMAGAAGAGVAHNRDVLQTSPAWARLTRHARFPEASESLLVPNVQMVHGSPRDPVLEYVWPGHPSYFQAFNRQLDERLGHILDARAETHCFCGHTHVPALLTPAIARTALRGRTCNTQMTFIGPTVLFFVPGGSMRIEGLSELPAIINPGSVGQPRDGDSRASYVLFDGDSAHFRRVPYDIATAQARIRALPIDRGAREYLAERIAVGG